MGDNCVRKTENCELQEEFKHFYNTEFIRILAFEEKHDTHCLISLISFSRLT